jgi:hypothetical protein
MLLVKAKVEIPNELQGWMYSESLGGIADKIRGLYEPHEA